MTDNEIKKALDWCEQIEDNIVLSNVKATKCIFALQSLQIIKQVLKDYNRQRAEIERLKDLNNQLETDIINANMNLEHITYEFDLLKQEKSVVIAEVIKETVEKIADKLNHFHVEIPFPVGGLTTNDEIEEWANIIVKLLSTAINNALKEVEGEG